jgi:hypothetical protein
MFYNFKENVWKILVFLPQFKVTLLSVLLACLMVGFIALTIENMNILCCIQPYTTLN